MVAVRSRGREKTKNENTEKLSLAEGAGGDLVYRPFVDGLRAVSIIAVVGFHVGLPGFGGGFIGVDVFFVISGFLIIGQIAAAMRADRFSFTAFYARRVLRILPPLLIVLLSTMAIAPFILLTPREYAEFGRSALASALMYANHYFLGQQGYFDTDSDLKPLLHLWTLSVEEQFYLVAPVVLVLLARLAARRCSPVRRVWLASTAIIGFLSLLGCILLTRHLNYGFYLMPLRGWEFMAGGALGIGLPAAPRMARHAGSLAIAGLAAILAAVVLYGATRLYPSALALLPAGGAALVIYAGLAAPDNPVARLLARRPLVAIGLVSYSWYLWHWPLLAFSRIAQFGDRHLGTALAMALLSLLLAGATYWTIELPARAWRRQGWALRPRTVAAGVLACAGTAALGLAFADIAAPQVAQALPPGLLPPLPVERVVERGDPCAIRGDATLDPRCLAKAEGDSLGVLIGDSHARALYPVLRAVVQSHGQRLISLFSLGCAPLLSPAGTYSPSNAAYCARRNDTGLRSIAAAAGDHLDFAIIEASWLFYGLDRELNLTDAVAAPVSAAKAGVADHRFSDRLAVTIQRLVITMHVRRIILVGPVPLAPHDVPACLIRADRQGEDRDRLCAYTRAQSDRLRATSVAMLRAMAERFAPTVRYVDPIGSFCDQASCHVAEGNIALFADQQHISDAGAKRLLAGAPADFLWAFAAADAGGDERDRTHGLPPKTIDK